MNPMLDKTLRLVLICGVAALLLGVVNSITEPVIKERKEQDVKNALSSLIERGSIGNPESLDNEKISQIFPVEEDDQSIAVILDMVGQGYGGDMRILASYNLDGSLIDARLMENAETPGLGKKAEASEYMDKFKGFGAEIAVPTSKNELDGGADAITGATITFNGVAQALFTGSEYVKGLK